MLGRIYVTKINVTKHIATLQNDNDRLKKKIESLEKTVVDLEKTIVSEGKIEYIIDWKIRRLSEIIEAKIEEAKKDCKISDERLEKSISGIVRSEIAKQDIKDQVLLKVVKAGLGIQENK